MPRYLTRIPKPIVVIVAALIVWQVWRAFMPLPPAAYIRWTYPKSMPEIGTTESEEIVPTDDSATIVDGIYKRPWGVIAVYHTDRAYRYAVLQKGWIWWRFSLGGEIVLEPVQSGDDIAYGVGIPNKHLALDEPDTPSGFYWGQVVVGRRITPEVQGVRVTFADGFTQDAPVINEHFVVFSTEHGAACNITSIGTNGVSSTTEQIVSFITREDKDSQALALTGFEPADVDCTGI